MPITAFLKSRAAQVKKPLILAIGLAFMSGVVLILQAWLLARIVSSILIDKTGIYEVSGLLMLLPVLFVVRAVLAFAAECASFEAAVRVKHDLRMKLYDHLAKLGPVRLAGEGTGDLVNMLTDGIEALEAYYARYLPAMVLMVLLPLAILVVVLPHDWLSALVMVVTAPLIPFFMVLIGKGTEKLNQRQWRKLARLSAHFLDMIQGLTTLKLFNAGKREAAAIGRMSEDYRQSTMSVLRVAFLSSLVLEFFATVSIAMIAVFIGFRLLYDEILFLHGFFVLLLAPDFYLPLRQMGTHYHARMEAIGAAERMVEVLNMKTLEPVIEGNTSVPKKLSIRFDDVHYTYEGERPALRGVEFKISPGENVAIVGPSGSGKSTILALLQGFITPDKGEVSICDEPLSQLDRDDWRHTLSYVPQSPTLFLGSILDNIRLGSPQASLADVKAAAQAARADEFIEQLPGDYDHMIGERGTGLSGGQIQRIAIARALLRNSPLVLFDEPTANLDLENERLVSEALEKLAAGRTVITIAHRLSTTRHADKLLVCDQGRIVEQGAHAALMEQQGLYFRLATTYAGSDRTMAQTKKKTKKQTGGDDPS